MLEELPFVVLRVGAEYAISAWDPDRPQALRARAKQTVALASLVAHHGWCRGVDTEGATASLSKSVIKRWAGALISTLR